MKKRGLITLAVCVLFVTPLLWAEDGEDAMALFRQYSENPTPDHFMQAWKTFSTMIEKDPGNTQARLLASYLMMSEVHRNLDWFAEQDSLDLRTRFQYANILLELGQNKEAVKHYAILNEAAPKWSCPWRHKGEALYKLHEYDDAEKALDQAIETRKEHYDAYVWLAKVQLAAGKHGQALETLETGLTYKGKDIEDPEEEVASVDVDFLLMKLYSLNGRDDKAKEVEKRLLENAPNDPRWEER